MRTELVWITPNAEQMISDMARVSAPKNQGLSPSGLMNYLVTHNHWSPYEMANACFMIETTRDIARQLLRHRSFSFQEFSQRYANVDELPEAPNREARLQDSKNRQNSLPNNDYSLTQEWEEYQNAVRQVAEESYDWAISKGIAKEVARAVLPEGLTTSRMYMNGTIRSWMHFCKLRCGNGTQKETKGIADNISRELKEHFPTCWGSLMET
jgi:thymidylate synthase (FAD)